MAVLVFVAGVKFLLEAQWLLAIGSYVALNLFIEANSSLKDWSSESHISIYDEEVKCDLLNRFPAESDAKVFEPGDG